MAPVAEGLTALSAEAMPGRKIARVAYDSIASAISPYGEPTALEVARQLDAEVLGLLRSASTPNES